MIIDNGAETQKLYSLSTSQGGMQMLQATNLWPFPECQAKCSATLNSYADTVTFFFFIIIALPLLHRKQQCRETGRESEL